MKIYLDSANLSEINSALKIYKIEGITTNPTILANENTDISTILRDLKSLVDEYNIDIHIQALSSNADTIFEEAKQMNKFFGNKAYIKIPITEQGLLAIEKCKKHKINVTATAVFTTSQALLAARAGAKYVAPYVNRIDNISGNGVEIVENIISVFKKQNLDTEVLAASFKNTKQVIDVLGSGPCSVTITPSILKNMLFHPYTEKSIDDFSKDWMESYGNINLTDIFEN